MTVFSKIVNKIQVIFTNKKRIASKTTMTALKDTKHQHF